MLPNEYYERNNNDEDTEHIRCLLDTLHDSRLYCLSGGLPREVGNMLPSLGRTEVSGFLQISSHVSVLLTATDDGSTNKTTFGI